MGTGIGIGVIGAGTTGTGTGIIGGIDTIGIIGTIATGEAV
jgi:hypothetical protein